MAEAVKRISLAEASDHLATLVERVLREGEPVMIETGDGELVALTPVSSTRARTEADWAAFRAAAGSWADVDIDAFLKDIYTSRRSSRPPVEL